MTTYVRFYAHGLRASGSNTSTPLITRVSTPLSLLSSSLKNRSCLTPHGFLSFLFPANTSPTPCGSASHIPTAAFTPSTAPCFSAAAVPAIPGGSIPTKAVLATGNPMAATCASRRGRLKAWLTMVRRAGQDACRRRKCTREKRMLW